MSLAKNNMEAPQITINETKAARLTIKNMIDTLNHSSYTSRSRSLAITKLDEAFLWLGKSLESLEELEPTHQ